jgi:large subunit ribosomal protein L6
MTIEVTDGEALVKRRSDARSQRALHGLTRSLLANMVQGVTEGFERRLEIQGTGYRAEAKNNRLDMALGYSHTVVYEPPEGVEVDVENQTIVIVRGIDKELVGQAAAEIRMLRKVEPYKGKGIRYVGEHVRRKAGKAGKVGAQQQ